MKRYIEDYIRQDLAKKMVLLSGPRQVGKTTLSKQIMEPLVYLNYDAAPDRAMIRKMEWDRNVKLIIFDELHKMRNWKSWLKGIYDTRGILPALLVTGSARLDLFRKGGDSLAGRFHAYRLHPLTVREICTSLPETATEALDNLLRFGGFPEPYLEKDETHARRWRKSHLDIIVRQDILDLEKVRDLKSIEILIDLLKARVGASTSYSALAEDLQVSPHTIKHWLEILENLCVIFSVQPYHKNIARSILKEAKYFFYDNGAVEGDLGSKLENVVAGALLREIHFFEETTGRKGQLYYLRDKEKNEVDFLVVLEKKPWLMIEAKTTTDHFAKSLFHFQKRLPGVRAIQVVYRLERNKSSGSVDMLKMDEFLLNLNFQQ